MEARTRPSDHTPYGYRLLCNLVESETREDAMIWAAKTFRFAPVDLQLISGSYASPTDTKIASRFQETGWMIFVRKDAERITGVQVFCNKCGFVGKESSHVNCNYTPLVISGDEKQQ